MIANFLQECILYCDLLVSRIFIILERNLRDYSIIALTLLLFILIQKMYFFHIITGRKYFQMALYLWWTWRELLMREDILVLPGRTKKAEAQPIVSSCMFQVSDCPHEPFITYQTLSHLFIQ